MNIKKEVVSRIQNEIAKQQRDLRYRLKDNAYQINKLAEDSAITKRQLSMINSIIHEIEGDK